jgi:hypothetical protein
MDARRAAGAAPEPTGASTRGRLGAAIVALTTHRSPDRTICPSDAARAVGGESWRSLMAEARDAARALAAEGRVEIIQRGERLDPTREWRGPVRIRALPPG